MGILKSFFGKNKKNTSSQENEVNKYMPKENTPVDELFTLNFMRNGGKFIYCDDMNEVASNFNSILEENSWSHKNVLCYNDSLKNRFNNFNIEYTNKTPSFFFTNCESLIADKGSILISSNQIKEQKLNDLPNNFILFATTSQLKETISEGLRTIKNGKTQIPSNITTLKDFNFSKEKDFMSYGNSAKNLYLLLLEDL
jgi:L-lactate utilization protein LutC